MLIHVNIKVAEGCKMMTATSSEYHDGILWKTASVISD